MKKPSNSLIGAKVSKVFGSLQESHGLRSVLASIISILIGLIFGFFLLLVLKPERAAWGIGKIIGSSLSDIKRFARVLYFAAPILMTGLAVGVAFKTGLFNIGATGQYTMGGFFALYTAIVWGWPWYLALIAAFIGGGIWGAIPGLFKAFFNVHEVISSIMFNWIGLYLVNLMAINTPKMLDPYVGNRTVLLSGANPKGIIPKWGLDQAFNSNFMNISIFLAILIAVVMFIVINRTTFGYELKACGFNRFAGLNMGIDAKRSIVLSMVIAGALAGFGGGLYFLSGIGQYLIEANLLAAGFNGISVALLGASNPLGIIFSALFISYIQVGGDALQPVFAKETIDVIIAVIIYMSAFSLIVKSIIAALFKRIGQRKKAKEEVR
ncbi:MAG: ABC transporter permease [Clostridiales bacterium]|jgi:simple sugar transport system permease protein|nr:ABC transporter permease [Clostridiales bacterium]